MGTARAPLVGIALATTWVLAQVLALPLVAAAATVAAVWAAAAAAPLPTGRLHLALAAVSVPVLGGLLLLLGPCRSGLAALMVQAAMVAILAPLAPLLYAWTFSSRDGCRPR